MLKTPHVSLEIEPGANKWSVKSFEKLFNEYYLLDFAL